MLKKINSLSDLKKLNIEQLPALCEEIREKLLSTVLANGGHLASNLGVVELTVALHYVFNDTDKIVWDVGHQSYVHKLLTGRLNEFNTLRQKGGLSGFPDITESQHDVFGVGHASTAISAGLGIAKARDIKNQNFDVVAVVGDGSLTGGLSYEGLNQIDKTKMFIVLNDNNMAIDKNVGSATKNLSKVRVSKSYLRFKKNTKKFLQKLPLIGKPLLKMSQNIARNIRLKKLRNIYFENFNIRYIGPINGHDIKELVFYLTEIKNNIDKPTVLHVLTKKGKGYLPAESEPNIYHGVSPNSTTSLSTMSNIVGETLCDLAKDNPKIAVITAAMADGTGTAVFRERYPNRFFDVGIAEEHAVTFAAGLASQGLNPFVVIYSTFLQRAYDQILHDVCLQNLPVTFCIDRAGFVGQDGQTHQGLFDICFLSSIPNIKLFAPSSSTQLKEMLSWATTQNSPIAIRYSKSEEIIDEKYFSNFNSNGWNFFGDQNSPYVFLAVGNNCFNLAIKAMEALQKENFSVCVVDVFSLKPLDKKMLTTFKNSKLIITLEESMLTSGFASMIDLYYASQAFPVQKIIHLGVDDKFVKHATISEQLKDNGLTVDNLINLVKNNL